MKQTTTPHKGLRFKHSRVLDPAKMPEREPMLFQVTRIARGLVYYKPVIQRINEQGEVYREDIDGCSQYCPVGDFAKYCLEVV